MGEQGIVSSDHSDIQKGISMRVLLLVWVLVQIGIVSFLVLYGGLLLPRGSTARQAGGPELAVATYNTFG
jgi:hypothetical protein